jgi:hypothetical protein
MANELLQQALESKVKALDSIKAKIQEHENARMRLLQDGLELQGAIKQLGELLQAQAAPAAAPEAAVPANS